ncbi:MAG: NAD(P)/FAD-dependent oxidoreductase [Promethearchaeota archaeon]
MNFDLIIIGGGPGGATAAKLAAEYGANVCLLEAAKEGRYKCCAGGVPVSNEAFSPIPRNVGEREITGGVLVTPEGGPLIFDTTEERDKGYCMFRTDFDKFLLNLAQDAGVNVLYGNRVKSIDISKLGEVIVSGAQNYRSKCVIIASGIGGAQLQRTLGMEIPPIINGIQAEFDIPESIVDEQFGNRIWEFFYPSIINHGIAWAFPKRDAVSVGVLGKNVKMNHFNSFLQTPVIKDKITGRKMIAFNARKIWAAPIPDRMIKKPYREHVMIIGDACGTADPILYEGIYQARLSGKLAAEVFIQAFEDNDFGEERLSQYHHLLMEQLYEKGLQYSYKFHELLYHSGLIDKIIGAAYKIAQEDTEIMQSMISLFSGTQTRKIIWKTLMSRKWRLLKELGILNGVRLLPSLLRSLRI